MFRKIGILTAAAGILLSMQATAQAATSDSSAKPDKETDYSSSAEYCTPYTKVKYRLLQSKWKKYEGGTYDNRQGSSTGSAVLTHDTTYSLKGTISGSTGVKISAVIVEFDGRGTLELSASAAFKKGQKYTFKVKAGDRIKYRHGIKQHDILVKKTQMYSNCHKKTTSSTAHLPEKTSWVKKY